MKTIDEINKALDNLPSTADPTEFPAMTYESGWEEALMWVLGEDDEIVPPARQVW